MEAVECYYETILNVFGTGALPAGSGICDLKDPYRQNCTFLHHCEEAQRVQIMVHHCGSFYVYRLTAVRDLKSNKFFVARKGGLYCGSKDAHVPVSGKSLRRIHLAIFLYPLRWEKYSKECLTKYQEMNRFEQSVHCV